jgi:hypothetical protein
MGLNMELAGLAQTTTSKNPFLAKKKKRLQVTVPGI